MNNLRQIGIARTVYMDDNRNRLPVCAGYLPSHQPDSPLITTTLFAGQKTNELFRCPADHKIFPVEQTSYEWNF